MNPCRAMRIPEIFALGWALALLVGPAASQTIGAGAIAPGSSAVSAGLAGLAGLQAHAAPSALAAPVPIVSAPLPLASLDNAWNASAAAFEDIRAALRDHPGWSVAVPIRSLTHWSAPELVTQEGRKTWTVSAEDYASEELADAALSDWIVRLRLAGVEVLGSRIRRTAFNCYTAEISYAAGARSWFSHRSHSGYRTPADAEAALRRASEAMAANGLAPFHAEVADLSPDGRGERGYDYFIYYTTEDRPEQGDVRKVRGYDRNDVRTTPEEALARARKDEEIFRDAGIAVMDASAKLDYESNLGKHSSYQLTYIGKDDIVLYESGPGFRTEAERDAAMREKAAELKRTGAVILEVLSYENENYDAGWPVKYDYGVRFIEARGIRP